MVLPCVAVSLAAWVRPLQHVSAVHGSRRAVVRLATPYVGNATVSEAKTPVEEEDETRQLWAAFSEPGGEFELDMEAVSELVDEYHAAELRWQADGGLTRRCGVLDDPGSKMYAWWHDPVDGPEATAQSYLAALQVRRRIDPVLRLVFFAVSLTVSFTAPVRVARISARWGIGLHIVWPAVRLALAGVARARAAGRAAAPRPDATHILSAQHLTGATAVLALAALQWRSGGVGTALLFGAVGRVGLWPGLWHWRDLNRELLSPVPFWAHLWTRSWRLATSALLLAEVTLHLRLAVALDATGHFGAAASALGTLAPPLSAAGLALQGSASSVPLVAALRPLFDLLGVTRLTAALAAALTATLTAADLAALSWILLAGGYTFIGCYAAYWFAFPIEGGERVEWRPSLQPRRAAVSALSSALLYALRIVRPPESFAELRRAHARDRGLLPRVRAGDEGSTPLVGTPGAYGAKAAALEDLRLQMWAFSPDDQLDVDGTGMARAVRWDGERGERDGAGERAGLATPPAASGRFGEGAGFFELGRLFLAEDSGARFAVPEERRWTRRDGEQAVQALFERNQTFASGSRAVMDVLRLEYGLDKWNEDPPPGYTMPEIVLDSELEDTKKQFQQAASSRWAAATREVRPRRAAAQGADLVAPEPMSVSTASREGDGLAELAAGTTAATDPRIAEMLQQEEGVEEGAAPADSAAISSIWEEE